MIEPVRKLRIFVAMAARLLPGVRCSTACTVYSSPSWRMIIPGRSWVALIPCTPDADGMLRQALDAGCVLASRSPGGQGSAALENKIIDAAPRPGQRAGSFDVLGYDRLLRNFHQEF